MEEKPDWLINLIEGGIKNVAQAQTSGYEFELKPAEDYWENKNIQKKFNNDKTAFEDVYKQARQAYEVYQELDSVPSSAYRSKAVNTPFTRKYGLEVDIEPIKYDRILDVTGEKIGFTGINEKSGAIESVRERAQQTGFYVNTKGEKVQKDLEGLSFLSIGSPLVLATYDEKGTHIDPITGEKVKHNKGDLKFDPETLSPYYEEAGSRDTTGKEILQFADAITPEKHWTNSLNVFEGDDVESSAVKSIIKTGLKIAPLFIPYVGQAYALGYGLTNLADAGLEAYKSLDAIINNTKRDDQKTANELQNWLKVFSNTSVTDESRKETFTVENFGNLLYNIVGEVVSQASIATLPQKLAALSSRKVGTSKLLDIYKGAFKDISSLKDDLGEEAYRKYADISRNASLAYNVLIGSKEIADTADLSGLTNREGAFLQLGTGAVLGALYRLSPFEQWIDNGLGLGEQSSIIKNTIKETYGEVAEKAGLKSINEQGKFLQKLYNNLNNKFNNPVNRAGFANAAISEALEEETELAVNVGAKAMYNTLQSMGYTEQNKNKFKIDPSEIAKEAIMTGLAGAAGGVLFKALGKLPEMHDPDLQELISTHGSEKLIKTVEQLHKAKALPARYDVTLEKEDDGTYKLAKKGEATHADVVAGLTIAQIEKQANKAAELGLDRINQMYILSNYQEDQEELKEKLDEFSTIELEKDTPFIKRVVNLQNQLYEKQEQIKLAENNPTRLSALQSEYDEIKSNIDDLAGIVNKKPSKQAAELYKQGLISRMTSIHDKVGVKTRNSIAKDLYRSNYWELTDEQKEAVNASYTVYRNGDLFRDLEKVSKDIDDLDSHPVFKELVSVAKNDAKKERIADNLEFRDFIIGLSQVLSEKPPKQALTVIDDMLENPSQFTEFFGDSDSEYFDLNVEKAKPKLQELRNNLVREILIDSTNDINELGLNEDFTLKDLVNHEDVGSYISSPLKTFSKALKKLGLDNKYIIDESVLSVVNSEITSELLSLTSPIKASVKKLGRNVGVLKDTSKNTKLNNLLKGDFNTKLNSLEELAKLNVDAFITKNGIENSEDNKQILNEAKSKLASIENTFDLPKLKIPKKFDELVRKEIDEYYSDPTNYLDNSEGRIKEKSITDALEELNKLTYLMQAKAVLNSAINRYVENSKLVPKEQKDQDKLLVIADNTTSSYQAISLLQADLEYYKNVLTSLLNKLIENRQNQLNEIQKITLNLAKAQVTTLSELGVDVREELTNLKTLNQDDISEIAKADIYTNLASAAKKFRDKYKNDNDFKDKIIQELSKSTLSMPVSDNSFGESLTGEHRYNFITSLVQYNLSNTFYSLRKWLEESDSPAPLANQLDNLIQLNAFVNYDKSKKFSKVDIPELRDFIYVSQNPGYGKTKMLAKTLVGMNQDKKVLYFGANKQNIKILKEDLDLPNVDHDNSGDFSKLLSMIGADAANDYMSNEQTTRDGILITKTDTDSFTPSINSKFVETDLIIIDEATHLSSGQAEVIQMAVSKINEKRTREGKKNKLRVVALGDSQQLGKIKGENSIEFNTYSTKVRSTTKYDVTLRSGFTYIPEVVNNIIEQSNRKGGNNNQSYSRNPASVLYTYFKSEDQYLGLNVANSDSSFKEKAAEVYEQYLKDKATNPAATIAFISNDIKRLEEVFPENRSGIIFLNPSEVQSAEFDYVILDEIINFKEGDYSTAFNLTSLNTFISRGRKIALLNYTNQFDNISFIGQQQVSDVPSTNVKFTPEIIKKIKDIELKSLAAFDSIEAEEVKPKASESPKPKAPEPEEVEFEEPEIIIEDDGYFNVYPNTIPAQQTKPAPTAYTLFLTKATLNNPTFGKFSGMTNEEFAKKHLQMMNAILFNNPEEFKEVTRVDINDVYFTVETFEKEGDYEIVNETEISQSFSSFTAIVMNYDGKKIPLFVLSETNGYLSELNKHPGVNHGRVSREDLLNVLSPLNPKINIAKGVVVELDKFESTLPYFNFSEVFVATGDIEYGESEIERGSSFVIYSISDKAGNYNIKSLSAQQALELIEAGSPGIGIIYVKGKKHNTLLSLYNDFKERFNDAAGDKTKLANLYSSISTDEDIRKLYNDILRNSAVTDFFDTLDVSTNPVSSFFTFLKSIETDVVQISNKLGLINFYSNVSIEYAGEKGGLLAKAKTDKRNMIVSGINGIRVPDIKVNDTKLKNSINQFKEKELTPYDNLFKVKLVENENIGLKKLSELREARTTYELMRSINSLNGTYSIFVDKNGRVRNYKLDFIPKKNNNGNITEIYNNSTDQSGFFSWHYNNLLKGNYQFENFEDGVTYLKNLTTDEIEQYRFRMDGEEVTWDRECSTTKASDDSNEASDEDASELFEII